MFWDCDVDFYICILLPYFFVYFSNDADSLTIPSGRGGGEGNKRRLG